MKKLIRSKKMSWITEHWLRKVLILKLTLFLICPNVLVVAGNTYSQTTKPTLSGKDVKPEDVLLDETGLKYEIVDKTISLSPKEKETEEIKQEAQKKTITGKITDEKGLPLPGVSVVAKGTTVGIITDINGSYSLETPDDTEILVFSFIGMKTQEVEIGSQTQINVTLEEEAYGLEEVVAIGYGTMRKSDLTGSVARVDKDRLKERPDNTVIGSLRGYVSGLNVGQVNESGGEPELSVRGATSLSGEQKPLIILDGSIYRGNIIDINPSDIESLDILKDISSTAIYGSQASNGVIIINTIKGEGSNKPIVNYRASYSFRQPTKEFKPENPEEYLRRVEAGYFLDSRTEESGYLESNPDWNIDFRTTEQEDAYERGMPTNWNDIVVNKRQYTQNHNLSLTQRTDNSNYFLSVGYSEDVGYMVGEDYKKWNARVNVDNSITDWLDIGIQSFMTSSDYSGVNLSPESRYNQNPYAPAYDEFGELVQIPSGVGTESYNPLYIIGSDDLDKRLNLFGNVYANIKLPFIKGLSFKTNYNTNYRTTSNYFFRTYENSFLGNAEKRETIATDWSNDNILTYKNTFNDDHKLNVTLVYGREKRRFTSTLASATEFNSHLLGYNRLQAGSSELQGASSNAWEETSLYSMGRLFYSYQDKYLLTGTIRRDGFSGFSEKNKFGLFPSGSAAWIVSKESFFSENIDWFDYLKIRASYGSTGNRTSGRYQTLSRVDGGFNYINGEKKPVYAQTISDLANSELKWETTTGINLGIDYAILGQRINGSVEYYSNNTTDLLYDVDIPGISKFETFPDNLGEIHNSGIEIVLSSTNIDNKNFKWNSHITFSRNRDELKKLLGFDNNNDGREDDLISENLFIGHSLNTVYDLYTSGETWQLNEDIPSTADVGSYKIDDIDNNEAINLDDRKIIGYEDPSYRFGIENRFSYKNWKLSFFINSVQGSSKYYLGADNYEDFNSNLNAFDRFTFPVGLDFWTPENPDARYQRQGIDVTEELRATRYIPRSFVRIQDLNLSYSFDEKFLKRFKIQDLRLFFNGTNLYTFTRWPGWDPETGDPINRSGRPVLRSFTFGIDIKF